MMMNKKGFTLIELLAVIAIIALISMIAIPNIVALQDGIKKDQMLDDAKKLISMAKYQVNTDYDLRNLTKTGVCSGGTCTIDFANLNTSGDIKSDPDSSTGANYISGYVTYTNDGVAKFCVYLEGVKRKVCRESSCGSTTCPCTLCVYEENLYSGTNVRDK